MISSNYKLTHSSEYMGRKIVCRHYKPDISCEINGQFHGFFVSTDAAVNSAQKHILRTEDDKKKKNENP